MAAVPESAVLSDTKAQTKAQSEVWAGIARSYSAFSSPLVPCSEDIATVEREVARHAGMRTTQSLRAVILGVTPGLALMRWPQGSKILAAEISPAVIEALWPGDVAGVREAICASWFALPVDRGSCDVVLGDGSLATCRFPGEVRNLVRAVRRLLADNGIFIFRSYIQLPVQESLDEVFGALFSQAGLTVDRFKMRLFLAMQHSSSDGMAVREAAHVLDRYHLDSRAMRERLGWSDAAIQPFSAWRTSSSIYSFPTLDELREVLRVAFEEVSVTYPGYELGNCCPTMVMRAKKMEGTP